MTMRALAVPVVLLASIAGCDTVPKAGKEAREAAYSRMDAVTAQVTFQQARNAFETGQLERSEALVRGAIVRFPDEQAYYALLGRTLLEQQRLDEAHRVLVKAVEMDPDDAQSRYFLGCVHERWSDDDRAAEQFAAAADIEPERPQYAIAAGEAFVSNGQLDVAERHINESLIAFAHHPALWHLRAHIQLLMGDPHTAAAHCQEALLLAPDDQGIATDLCRMRFRAGDWHGCLDAIDVWAMRFGTPPESMNRLHARCLAATGRHDQARVLYRGMVEDDREDIDLWRERGMLAWAHRDWATVGRCGEALEKIGVEVYESDLFLSLHDRAGGDDHAARDRLESLVRRFPDRPEGWVVLATVRERLGDSSGSDEARSLALKCPSYPADESRVSGVFGTHGP